MKFDAVYWYAWESGNMIITDYIKLLWRKNNIFKSKQIYSFIKEIRLDFNSVVSLNELNCNMLVVNIKDASKLLQDLKKP